MHELLQLLYLCWWDDRLSTKQGDASLSSVSRQSCILPRWDLLHQDMCVMKTLQYLYKSDVRFCIPIRVGTWDAGRRLGCSWRQSVYVCVGSLGKIKKDLWKTYVHCSLVSSIYWKQYCLHCNFEIVHLLHHLRKYEKCWHRFDRPLQKEFGYIVQKQFLVSSRSINMVFATV